MTALGVTPPPPVILPDRPSGEPAKMGGNITQITEYDHPPPCHPEPAKDGEGSHPQRERHTNQNSVIIIAKVRSLLVYASRDDNSAGSAARHPETELSAAVDVSTGNALRSLDHGGM